MSAKVFPAALTTWFVLGLGLLCSGPSMGAYAAEEMKVQAILVWATDDAKPPEGKNYKPLEPGIRKRLRALKWKNYFEVRRVDLTATTGAAKKVAVSTKCELDVRALGNSAIEVTLYGKGKEVAKVKGVLPKNEILVPGGDAPNETAWLVILKRVD